MCIRDRYKEGTRRRQYEEMKPFPEDQAVWRRLDNRPGAFIDYNTNQFRRDELFQFPLYSCVDTGICVIFLVVRYGTWLVGPAVSLFIGHYQNLAVLATAIVISHHQFGRMTSRWYFSQNSWGTRFHRLDSEVNIPQRRRGKEYYIHHRWHGSRYQNRTRNDSKIVQLLSNRAYTVSYTHLDVYKRQTLPDS